MSLPLFLGMSSNDISNLLTTFPIAYHVYGDGKVVAQTTANAEGSFELKVKRGNYELTAVYTDANGQLVHKTIQIKAPVKGLTVTL